MLRLGDVQGCEGVRFEVIPGVMIEGQPAVRLLAEPGSGCTVAGAGSVVIGGETAKRQGDVNCP